MDILRTGVYYTHKSWLDLSVTDEARDITGQHARYVSPTYARVRTIILEGIIYRREAGKEAVDHLRSLFRLQGSSNSEVERHSIVVTDEFSDEWQISVKVKEPLSIKEGNDHWKGLYWSWRVGLESVG